MSPPVNRTRVVQATEQAAAIIQEQAANIVADVGRAVRVSRASLIEPAMKYLESSGLPARGYDVLVFAWVLADESGDEERSLDVPIVDTEGERDRQRRLAEAMDKYRSLYGVAPSRQKLKLVVKFLYDDSQIVEE